MVLIMAVFAKRNVVFRRIVVVMSTDFDTTYPWFDQGPCVFLLTHLLFMRPIYRPWHAAC